MLRKLALALVAIGLLVPGAFAATADAAFTVTSPPVVLSLTATPNHLPSSGGSIILAVKVKNATTCTFGGAGTVTLRCASGHAAVRDNVVANDTAQPKIGILWVVARGKGGVAAKRIVRFAEAAQPTRCTGPCKFVFPQSTFSGATSVALNSVAQGVPCPDPGLCDASVSQQIDAVNVTVCAGSSGISDAAGEMDNFSLALSGGTQATSDSVSFDGSVPGAFGTYGALGPGQCVSGVIYFDAPGGSNWTSVNFAYESGTFSTQLVYVWNA